MTRLRVPDAVGSRAVVVATLVAVALLSAIGGLLWWSTVPVVAGWQPTVVLTGSMQPALRPGDVVLVGTADATPDTLPEGRIVLVADPDRDTGTYLHRVARYEGASLVTRGDANAVDDHPVVAADRVLGQVRLVVPVIGRPVVWLREGRYAELGASLLVVWSAVLVVLRAHERRPDDVRHRSARRAPRRGVPAVAASTVLAVGCVGVLAAAVERGALAPFSATSPSGTATYRTGTWYISSYRDAVTASGPAEYWRLDETAGTTAYPSVGTLHGTYANGPSLGLTGAAPGRSGTSVAFDGADDIVTMGDAYDFAGNAVFTVEAWVAASPRASNFERVVAKQAWTDVGTEGFGWALLAHNVEGGGVELLFERLPDSYPTSVISQPLTTGAWYHVVVTYDGTLLSMYVDGALVSTVTDTRAAADSTAGLAIGGMPSRLHTIDMFQGQVDEVALYTKVLTATEIQTHYTAARP